MAADDWLYEYSIVRYVPRPERGEFLNIGLVMMNKRRRWMKGMIVINEKKLLTLFPDIDLNSLLLQASLFERDDAPQKELPVEEKYRWLTAEKSGCIRVSPSHPGIVINPEDKELTAEEIMNEEFERLLNLLVK